MNTTLAIQAGGESSRMGENKALRPFLGQPLIQRVLLNLSPIFQEVLLTANQPEIYAFLGVRTVPDLQPGNGALGGLLTALHYASNPVVAVVACDMPFASRKLLQYQMALLMSEGMDVAIPSTESGLEPLHCVFRRETCLPAIQKALQNGERRMISWFSDVKVRVLTLEEVTSIEPSGLSFINVNTPEEFARAEELAKS